MDGWQNVKELGAILISLVSVMPLHYGVKCLMLRNIT